MPGRSPICSVNDFVVRFANVNGSGSASANELFARAVLRMGVPVSSRNIFPSNIQGLHALTGVGECLCSNFRDPCQFLLSSIQVLLLLHI